MNDKILWSLADVREFPEELINRISRDQQAGLQVTFFAILIFQFSAHLVLWVNHEGPPASLRDQNAVLGGHRVPGKTLCVPLADDVRVAQDVGQAEAGADGDVELLAAQYPLVGELEEKGGKLGTYTCLSFPPLILEHRQRATDQLPVVGGERSAVGHAGRRNEDVAHHVDDLLFKHGHAFVPAHLLVAQGRGQLAGPSQPALGQSHVVHFTRTQTGSHKNRK